MGMFDFFGMIGNYEDRKVAHDEAEGGLVIDTAEVNDGNKRYETAVSHPEYNDDKWVIVEAYDTKEEAAAGHERWKKIMTTDPLPEALKDCCNAEIAQFTDALAGGDHFVFPRKVKV